MKPVPVTFDAVIEKFGNNGEKTGWTYIEFPTDIAAKLLPGNRKSFRIKGTLDKYKFVRTSLIPIGKGNFILPVNATIRKATGKKYGDTLTVKAAVDLSEIPINKDLMDCLRDEPAAFENFMKYPPSHRNYYSKWIESAKTEATKARRIVMCVESLLRGWDYGQMLRNARDKKY